MYEHSKKVRFNQIVSASSWSYRHTFMCLQEPLNFMRISEAGGDIGIGVLGRKAELVKAKNVGVRISASRNSGGT